MPVALVETTRYLRPCVRSLLEFCDEVVLGLDGWTFEQTKALTHKEPWGQDGRRVIGVEGLPSFYAHEGHARQALLEATLAQEPTHILAIDADEFIANGPLLREKISEPGPGSWQACMQEVWATTSSGIVLRQDAGWEEKDVTVVWDVQRLPKPLRIADRQLACGRVPTTARGAPGGHTGTACLHFGWANPAEREERYARYVKHDGGRFHTSAHLQSILNPDTKCDLWPTPWPTAWTNTRIEEVLEVSRPRDVPKIPVRE